MTRFVKIGDRVFIILYPDLLRPLSADERSRLKESIGRYGVQDAVHTDGKDGVIDGGHRLEIAAEIGFTDPDAIPIQSHEGLPAHELRELAEQLNDCRRQQSPAEIEARRLKRVAEAVDLRGKGLSTRAIAQRIGVSHTQVLNDLNAADSVGNHFPTENGSGKPDLSGVPSGTPDNGKPDLSNSGGPGGPPETASPLKVIGKDGKTYSAKKPVKKPKQAEPPAEIKDQLGNPVPEHLKKFFADEALSDLVATVGHCARQLQQALKDAAAICRSNKFIDVGLLVPCLGQDIYSMVEQGSRCLANGIPYAVCPKCNGPGCGDCRSCGWVPEWRYRDLGCYDKA